MIRSSSPTPCDTLDSVIAAPSFAARLARRFAPGLRLVPLVDPDTLPENLRRDLGFVDGRLAIRRDPRWD